MMNRSDVNAENSGLMDELVELANRFCEQRLSEVQAERLNTLLRQHRFLIPLFVEFIQIHGQLAWDAGHGVFDADAASEIDAFDRVALEHVKTDRSTARAVHGSALPMKPVEAVAGTRKREGREHRKLPVTAKVVASSSVAPGVVRPKAATSRQQMLMQQRVSMIAASVLICSTAFIVYRVNFPGGQQPVATVGSDSQVPSGGGGVPDINVGSESSLAASGADGSLQPLRLEALEHPRSSDNTIAGADMADTDDDVSAETGSAELVVIPDTDDEIVAMIDSMLDDTWRDHEVEALPEASDSEWLRRAYLTFAGRIPSIPEAREFLGHNADQRRQMLVQQLSQDPRTAESLSVMWLNLLIGRSNPRNVDAQALMAFLMERFRSNEPWIDTVGELVAAEGRSDENGATNFLLAHLNDQATPATAVTARLFLGQQVQCTQCHDHPFATDVTQRQFWELNAFFKQAARKQIVDPAGGVTASGEPSQPVWELRDVVQKSGDQMTYYETLSGSAKAVLPKFAGAGLSTSAASESRRAALVSLLKTDPEMHVARAMVNRMWFHFFGEGFTRPVDDMGPHNPPSNPELLEFLTRAFVKSGYDTRRLMMWIAMTSAWQRTSTAPAVSVGANGVDSGSDVEFDLQYTRVSPRQMLPEQLYDSIRVAIRSISQQPIDSSLGTMHRRDWVSQFVESFGTDENDESLQFDGTISQAMLMMNGEDLESAIPLAIRTLLKPESGQTVSASSCLEEIALAVLSRRPTKAEVEAFWKHQRSLKRSMTSDKAVSTALEDMLWAYLNSTEFIAVH